MCKMVHFGNCDPETADQEYCIFHKPNKSEEEAREFYRKFLEKFKPRVEEIEVDGGIVKRLVFEKSVDARGYVFPEIRSEVNYRDKHGFEWNQKFSFENANFESEVDFSNAIFEGNISFKNASFNKSVIFNEAVFEKDVSFENLIFGGFYYMGNKVCYVHPSQESHQFDTGHQHKSKNCKVKFEFKHVVFKGVVNFDNVTFCCPVYFDNSIFVSSNSETTNISSKFNKDASFREVIFKKKVEFLSEFLGNAHFEYAIFEQNVTFSRKTKFKGDVYFNDAIFKRTLSFEPTLNDVKFEGILDFSGSSFKRIEIDLPPSQFKHPEAEMEAMRVQRLSYELEGKRESADRVFVREMRAKRRYRLSSANGKLSKVRARIHNFFEWLLGDLPSEYGTNWIRLFIVSLLVIIGNATIYTFMSHQIIGFPQTGPLIYRFGNALYYSIVTFTTLGYGDMHPTGWLKALSALEALTGAVFMALIVAVIARKWMR